VNTRPLGATGIEVSEVGFGTWAIGGDAGGTLSYGPTDDAESLRALLEARRLGCTVFDTSNLYGWGHAEKLLGAAFADCRADVILATKAGYVTANGGQDFSSDAVRRSLDSSLSRLRTGYVDLLQLHNPAVDDLARHEELFQALEDLRHDRVVRAYGISARSPDDALVFARRYRPSFLQVNFNLGDLRALRSGLFECCRSQSIGVIARSPLAGGFLGGAIGPASSLAPTDHRRRFDAQRRQEWAEIIRSTRRVLDDVPGATPAQHAIRFVLTYDAVSTVIPGMTCVSEVTENLAAASFPQIQPRGLREIEAAYERVFESSGRDEP
jgi:aryl-alcohol dehydrogenase-like predicted oxidoreductase